LSEPPTQAPSDAKTNRLANETSPYLLQHQHNPVDWYPWGEEAFEAARGQDKLILLSVGYSACHWCHVMERESFEDPTIAAQMNEHFVCVKVDREERPDVDHIYMQVVQAMTGQGGWPMTVFMTADGTPIFGGTYYPPDDRAGMPGFPRVLAAVVDTYERRGEAVVDSGRELLRRIDREARPRPGEHELSEAILASAFAALSHQFDDRYGGMDRAPKFPQPMTWEFVLRYWRRTGDPRAEEMVRKTLTGMARGGMYDQIGGGFARYSVDGRWLVPHFEKMLYDNGQLARLYLDGWRALGDPEYRRVCEEILDYLVREMRNDAGGFYSATDADSEGEEGKFFVWTPEQVADVLGAGPVADAAVAYWGLDGPANFEGHWILNVPVDPAQVAERLGIAESELAERLGEAREALRTAREARVHPGLDDKVLTSWNALTCRAFAEAGHALGRADYLDVARANADFMWRELRRDDGRLLRTWKNGRAHLLAYLEDYANLLDALIALHGATLEARWLESAREIAGGMVALFWDEEQGGFFDTGSDGEALAIRPRDFFDNASPCGSSVAADALSRLGRITGDTGLVDKSTGTVQAVAQLMQRYPGGFGRWLCALDFQLSEVLEVALVWPDGGSPDELVEALRAGYDPNRILIGASEGERDPDIALFEGRAARDGSATAYVCRGATCLEPITESAALAAALGD